MRARDFDRDEFLSKTWPEALESGEFEQGKQTLIDKNNKYCCLGVACELLSQLRLLPRKAWKDDATLPLRAQTLLGIREAGEYRKPRGKYAKRGSLAGDNDRGETFEKIAKTIRRVHKAKLFEDVA